MPELLQWARCAPCVSPRNTSRGGIGSLGHVGQSPGLSSFPVPMRTGGMSSGHSGSSHYGRPDSSSRIRTWSGTPTTRTLRIWAVDLLHLESILLWEARRHEVR